MTIMLTALTVQAQINIDTYKYADATQLWRLTGNAAGLSLDPETCDSTANRGVAWFDLMHRSGDYRRVQEGGQMNQLRFYTERYQKIGKYLYGYGSFDFDMGRTKDRAWSDVLRSYNSNPYISGSSVPAKYDHQDFTLEARLATVPLGHFTYGASLLYKVGDLSRLRDPRSRINLAEYKLAPSMTYTTGQHTLGLTVHYDRRKEKLPNMTTVQTNPNLAYYTMTGLENATGTIGGYNGYMREYVNHEFGAELDYGFDCKQWQSVNALTLRVGREYVYGQYKYEPGTYRNRIYGLASHNSIKQGSLLHRIDAQIAYETGSADEYKSERISSTDAETGVTSVEWRKILEYKKRYQLKKLDASLHYRLSWVEENAVLGYAGLQYTMQNISNKYLLYTSEQKNMGSTIQIEGGHCLFDRHLWVEGSFDYHISHKAGLTLADATTDYAQAVLLPDMAYYEANYWQGRLAVTYQFPLTIKDYTSQWFVKVYGSYLKTNSNLKGQTAGLSFGLYY
jgi:hypothetical protein